MKKFHINDSGEVKPCGAKVRCRFGGASGVENHYTSQAEAQEEAQRRLAKKFGGTPSTRRAGSARPGTHTVKALEAKGMKVTSVSSVKSHKFSQGGDPAVSSVDLLDEKPDAALLDAIRSGRAAADLFS